MIMNVAGRRDDDAGTQHSCWAYRVYHFWPSFTNGLSYASMLQRLLSHYRPLRSVSPWIKSPLPL